MKTFRLKKLRFMYADFPKTRAVISIWLKVCAFHNESSESQQSVINICNQCVYLIA